jgi:hypothetical protein
VTVKCHDVFKDIPSKFILSDFNRHISGRIKEVDAALQIVSTTRFWLLQHKVMLRSVIHGLRQPRASDNFVASA